MNILVSTKETQGQRKNDFSHADEGEIVTLGMECDREAVDGRCGCKRALMGVHKGATTTMKVVDLALTRAEFQAIIFKHLEDGGWFKIETDPAKQQAWAKDNADELLRLAAFFKVGDVLEKRGRSFRTRRRTGDNLVPAVPK